MTELPTTENNFAGFFMRTNNDPPPPLPPPPPSFTRNVCNGYQSLLKEIKGALELDLSTVWHNAEYQ